VAAAGQAMAGEPAAHRARDGSRAAPVFSLTEMEKNAIIRALEYTKGDRVMAAHLLGIGRTTLYRKLKEYRLTD
jgi:transcriptional regulator of acetoin/glycerol metabolism